MPSQFDVSQLEAHVSRNNGKDFAKLAVQAAKTAKLLKDNKSVVLGAKGDNAIPTLAVDANIQDGSVKGRNPQGGASFGETILKIARFKDQWDYTSDDLYNTYLIEYVAKGQDPENEVLDTEIINNIMSTRAEVISSKMEEVLWKGNKVGLAPYNVAPWNLMDGILKQLSSATTLAITPDADLTTIVEKLQDAYVKVPSKISSAADFRIFMGEDTAKQYQREIFNNKYYAQVTADELAGFPSVKIEVVPGLNDTDKVVMSRISNIKLGLDKEGDMTTASLKWSIETEQWYMDFNFATGVLVVFPQEAGIFSIA